MLLEKKKKKEVIFSEAIRSHSHLCCIWLNIHEKGRNSPRLLTTGLLDAPKII